MCSSLLHFKSLVCFYLQQAVEAALIQLPMVQACCVVALGEEGEDKYLVAYVVPHHGNKVIASLWLG